MEKSELWIRSRWLTVLRNLLIKKQIEFKPFKMMRKGTTQQMREAMWMNGVPSLNIEKKFINVKNRRRRSPRILDKKSIIGS